MYDSLTFFKIQPCLEQLTLNSSMLESLKGIKEQRDIETGAIIYTGNLRNLRVKINHNGISVTGSLAKFYSGNNVESLTRATTKEAIEEVSDLLGVDMRDAQIYSLEFGKTFVMEHSARRYYPFLGSKTRCTRIDYKTGLSYQNGRKSLVIYDKTAELKSHKEAIPESFAGKNLLRCEIKIKNRLAKQLKRKEILGSDLYDPKVYCMLIKLLRKEYFSITRVQPLTLSENMLKEIKTVPQLTMILANIGLQELPIEEILALLKPNLTKQQYLRMKKKLQDVAAMKNPEVENGYILELDNKIKAVTLDETATKTTYLSLANQ